MDVFLHTHRRWSRKPARRCSCGHNVYSASKLQHADCLAVFAAACPAVSLAVCKGPLHVLDNLFIDLKFTCS
jgi:hypothetical protein